MWIDSITKLEPCWDVLNWMATPEVSVMTFSQAWAVCERGDWMLWLAARVGVDRKLVVLTACLCAEEALCYVPAGEERPRIAIETARRWARGEATLEEVRAAAGYAAEYAYAAEAVDAHVAYAAHDAAAYAAYAAHDAAAYAAYAADAYTADAYTADAYIAAVAAYAHAVAAYAHAADAYTAAQRASWKRSAELVRKHISAEMVRSWLK